MKSFSLFTIAVLLFASLATGQTRQTQPQKTGPLTSGFKGLGFIDYFYNVKSPAAGLENQNAFDIRRINLGYEHTFTRKVMVYSELEANDQDLTGAGKYSLFIKQAYVELRNLLPQSRVDMGLSPTPALVTSERIWGYRMLQKLPLDLYGLAPTVDNGIAMKGKIDPDGIVSYHVMVGNGTGTLVETDKTKRLYGSLGLTLAPGFTLEGYVDFENAGNDRSHMTMKALAGLEEGTYSIGAEVIYRVDHHITGPTSDQTPFGMSLYGWLENGEDMRFVYRVDFFDPNRNRLDTGVRTITGILGLDYLAIPEVHIVPNMSYTSYWDKNPSAAKLNDALTLRLTAAFYFSSIK